MNIIWQQDPKYADWTLGSTQWLVSRYGCAVCCVAMALDESLLDIVNTNIGFNSNGFIIWENFGTVKKRLFYDDRPVDMNEIASWIKQGYRVILDTRFGEQDTLDAEHFVLATEARSDNQDVLIADPWYGDSVWFSSRYGEPTRWIYQIIVYEKKYDVVSAPDEMMQISKQQFSDLITKLDTQEKLIEQQKSSISTLEKQIINNEADIEKLKQQLATPQPDNTLAKLKEIMNGSGWWWTKWAKVKALVA